jgi:hypothetical protein
MELFYNRSLTIEALRKRLYQVKTEPADTLQRMPAHRIKPGFMARLLDRDRAAGCKGRSNGD